MDRQFTPATEEYIKKTKIKYRKKMGQYFTPKFVRDKLLHQLPQKRNPLILDPACGSGEFLLSAKGYFKNCRLVGWEIDCTLTRMVKKLYPEMTIIATDSLFLRAAPR